MSQMSNSAIAKMLNKIGCSVLQSEEDGSFMVVHNNFVLNATSMQSALKMMNRNERLWKKLCLSANSNGFLFLLDEELGLDTDQAKSNCMGIKEESMREVFGNELVDQMGVQGLYCPFVGISKTEIEKVLDEYFSDKWFCNIDKSKAIMDEDQEVEMLSFLAMLKESCE